jgi:hypothetical protein
MPLLKKILQKLNGLHYPQDYLCFGVESFPQPLNIYLLHDGNIRKDVSQLHSFVGYSPVIFAFPTFPEIENKEQIRVLLTNKEFVIDEEFQKKDAVAVLFMKKIRTPGDIAYYEGVQGSHHFTSTVHQYIEQVHNKLYNRKLGNVYLEGNLFKQVQVAYALPRKICLITVGINGLFNLFPTDLHGHINENFYIISLRHDGRACEQVIQAQKIVLSDMDAAAYKEVYSLGKNHMQPLKEPSFFDFSSSVSDVFRLPIQNGIVAYKELQLQDSFTHGIHRLLLFKIVNSKPIFDAGGTLAHIHNSYATWRYKKGLKSNYLLR